MGVNFSCSLGWCDFAAKINSLKYQIITCVLENKYKILDKHRAVVTVNINHVRYRGSGGRVRQLYHGKNPWRREIQCDKCKKSSPIANILYDWHHDLNPRVYDYDNDNSFKIGIKIPPSHVARVRWGRLRVMVHMLIYWFRFRTRYYLPGNGVGYLRAHYRFNNTVLTQ